MKGASDAIVVEFVKESIVRYCVKCFGEVEDCDIYLLACVK